MKTIEELDMLWIELNTALHCASSLFIPKAKYKPFLKPEWTPKEIFLHDRERGMKKAFYNANEDANYHLDWFNSIEKRYSKLEKASNSSNGSFSEGFATVNETQNISRNLKRRKAPVVDLIKSEHFTYGSIKRSRF